MSESIDPKQRRRERDRAQRDSMSVQEKALINQRRRGSYHVKKWLRTKETVDREKLKNRLPARKEGKREYKRRLKKILANNLHPDSIAMANPQWVPKFISPTPIEPIKSASELEIPDFSRASIYIPLLVEQTSNVHQIERVRSWTECT